MAMKKGIKNFEKELCLWKQRQENLKMLMNVIPPFTEYDDEFNRHSTFEHWRLLSSDDNWPEIKDVRFQNQELALKHDELLNSCMEGLPDSILILLKEACPREYVNSYGSDIYLRSEDQVSLYYIERNGYQRFISEAYDYIDEKIRALDDILKAQQMFQFNVGGVIVFRQHLASVSVEAMRVSGGKKSGDFSVGVVVKFIAGTQEQVISINFTLREYFQLTKTAKNFVSNLCHKYQVGRSIFSLQQNYDFANECLRLLEDRGSFFASDVKIIFLEFLGAPPSLKTRG